MITKELLIKVLFILESVCLSAELWLKILFVDLL